MLQLGGQLVAGPAQHLVLHFQLDLVDFQLVLEPAEIGLAWLREGGQLLL